MSQKVFIIEDDANILYGLQDSFSSDGYEVAANSADDDIDTLLKVLRAFSPDFLILDLILPKLDGFEIIKKIKESEDLADLRIFIFTDLSDEDSKSRSMELGVSYYFVKNEFDVYDFSEKVKAIIENREYNSTTDDDGVILD